MTQDDPKRYRVSLICKCNNDLAYGYGATIDEARAVAQTWFTRNHGRKKPREEVVERVSADGSHYEEVEGR